jgi:hypothetical protein
MISKVPLTLLCSAVLAFACGPRAHNEADLSDTPSRTTRVNSAVPLATSLDVTVDGEVTFDFAVINEGKKKLEVKFADGRTHDLVVLDSLGNEVWRWSEGRAFTQAMQNKVLRASDALRYEEEWDEPAPGRYVAVATLASRNYPAEQRVSFTVPER